jgi:cytochrome c553
MGVVGGLLLWGSQVYAAPYPAELVSMTKHNLSANLNIAFGSTTNGSSEVCVYCHTPHGASTIQALNTGFPPLWNRRVNTYSAYTTYADANSPHFDSADTGTRPLSTFGIKGVSLACLSCHDGTIAFDALVNLQGSGGYQEANATIAGAGGDHALADTLFGGFTGEAVDSTDHFFKTGTRANDTTGNPFGGSLFSNDTLDASGSNGTMPFPNLDVDLQDDHPISFEIPTTDPQFDEMIDGSVTDATSNLLYLKRSSAGPSTTFGALPDDKRDRIRAYPSAGETLVSGTAAGAYIECASCHNPHTPRTLFLRLPSNVDSTGDFVDGSSTATGLPTGGLLVSAPTTLGGSATYWSHAPNQGSAICLSCHAK